MDTRLLLVAIVLLPVTAWGFSDGIERNSRVDIADDTSSYVSLSTESPHLTSENQWMDVAFHITHAHGKDTTMEVTLTLKDGFGRFSLTEPTISMDFGQTRSIKISDSEGTTGTFNLETVFLVEIHTTQLTGRAVMDREVQVVVE